MSGAMMALVNNNVASATGPTPGSIYFPTTGSRITLTPGIVVGGTYQSPFTVEGWFYSGDGPGQNSGPVILSTDTGSGTPAYAKALTINCLSTTGPQIVVDSNGAAANTFGFTSSPDWQANTWYYVAVTRDSSGYIQVWLGKAGDSTAVASTSGRFDCSANTSAWALTGLSNCIGAFVPANRFSDNDDISGVRVTNTNLYTTTDATIPMPTQTFGYVAGIQFLQSPTDLTDLTGNQTLASVGSAAYTTDGPAIDIQIYVEPTTISFTSVGTTSWTAPAGVTTVEYLVVAGGGGGGGGYDNAGGGGGGGGMVLTGNVAVTPGQSYTVTVGAGGAGGSGPYPGNYGGSAGNNSVFATVTSLGGGAGGGSRTGGSPGAAQIGSTTAPTGGSGNGGGSAGDGGGGATGAGTENLSTGGVGGAGLTSSITGSSVEYSAGGNGGDNVGPTNGANGGANTGKGGGGASSPSGTSASGGDGGSGIVVVKYGY